VNGRHLRRQHCFQLILRLDSLDDRKHEIELLLVPPSLTEDGFRVTGGLIGGTLGYNWQVSGFVFGFEGDLVSGFIPAGTKFGFIIRLLKWPKGGSYRFLQNDPMHSRPRGTKLGLAKSDSICLCGWTTERGGRINGFTKIKDGC
jgi:hypothetical protein